MRELTLGISPCPNDVFIFSGLLLNQIDMNQIDTRETDNSGLRFHVDFQDVENLNQRSQNGDLDVVKISYANYIHIADRYHLLSCGGALGRGVGPLLLSHDSAWDPEHEVLVPGVYTTANFLLDFYIKNTGVKERLQRPLNKRFLPFDVLYQELCDREGAQGVVIHEKRFTYRQDGLNLVADLGAYWEEQTGFAIPLGGIVVKEELMQKYGGFENTISDLIRKSLQWAYAHYDEAFALCRQYAQDLSAGTVESHIELYVNEYSLNLGSEGEAAVAFFLSKQQEFLQETATFATVS